VLARALSPHGTVRATARAQLDLSDADAIARTVRTLRPAWIVNAAAYTAVDRAEQESDRAFAINGTAPGVLAEEARRAGAVLFHFSTDYVFDGERRTPYVEDAPTAPLNVYGASKLAGERAVAAADGHAIVFRTSWVYGTRGSNFMLTMRRLAKERPELRVVADQIGVPNWTHTLADAIAGVVGMGLDAVRERRGLYHLSSAGETSWYEFARAIVGSAVRVVPITTAEFPTPARRPAYGVLDTRRFRQAFGFALPAWDAELERCLATFSHPGD